MEATTMSSCMTFDCVIRAIKLGKTCARPEWPDGHIIYVENNKVLVQMAEDASTREYQPNSEDMLARDWIIPIKDYRKVRNE